MAEPLRSRAELFLDEHPPLREAKARSAVWPRLRSDAAIDLGPGEAFIVGHDTLGGEAELFLDRLARGARAESADPLSRALFLELPSDLQAVVRRNLLLEREDRTQD